MKRAISTLLASSVGLREKASRAVAARAGGAMCVSPALQRGERGAKSNPESRRDDATSRFRLNLLGKALRCATAAIAMCAALANPARAATYYVIVAGLGGEP